MRCVMISSLEKADQAIVELIDKIYMCKIPRGPWCVCENLKVVLDLKMSESLWKDEIFTDSLTLETCFSLLIKSLKKMAKEKENFTTR